MTSKSNCLDVLLTVHICIFISVFNQLDAQNLFHNKFLFHASTCFEHMCSSSGGQNCIHSLWYYHTYRCDDTSFFKRDLIRSCMKKLSSQTA